MMFSILHFMVHLVPSPLGALDPLEIIPGSFIVKELPIYFFWTFIKLVTPWLLFSNRAPYLHFLNFRQISDTLATL